jgi:hypothetical protein
MPYVKKDHRDKLDPVIQKISEELAAKASEQFSRPHTISQIYFERFHEISYQLACIAAATRPVENCAQSSLELAKLAYDIGSSDGSFWAGDLNYSLTRIIQLVPKNLVRSGAWQKEFRYWIYAATCGGLERAALSSDRFSGDIDEWIKTIIVGVLIDIKDEYKRRVNAPYEEKQIAMNGDCYDVIL